MRLLPRSSECFARARPNRKITLAVRPASVSAPAITRNSICIDADCFCIDVSAAANATGGATGCGAGWLSSCGLAGGSAAATRRSLGGEGLVSELSGQRDATGDDGAATSGAAARRLFWTPAGAVAAVVRGSTLTPAPASCSTRIGGTVNSARASATDLRTLGLGFGGGTRFIGADADVDSGGVDDDESSGAARALLSLSSRRDQPLRLLA